MRPEFAAELKSILRTKDELDEKEQRRLGVMADDDEDFTQNFQEILEARILPQFEFVAGILTQNYYPVEVKIIGLPGEKACYLTFSDKKVTGAWALKGGQIAGPRMAFRAERADRNVAYLADYKNGKAPCPETRMQLSEVTDGFIENEIRRLFESFGPDQQLMAVKAKELRQQRISKHVLSC